MCHQATLGPMFSSDGHLVTDDEEMARVFNTYFCRNIPDPVIIQAGENNLTDIDCSEPEVEVKLKELKPDKAASYGGLIRTNSLQG